MHLPVDNPSIRWQKAQILAKLDAEFPVPSVRNHRTPSPSVPSASNSRSLIVKKIVPITHVHSTVQDQQPVSTGKVFKNPQNNSSATATSTTELDRKEELVSKQVDRLKHLHFQQRNEISILKEELKSKLKQQQYAVTRDQVEREWLQSDREASIPPIPRSLNVLKPRRNNINTPIAIDELLRKHNNNNSQQQKPSFAMSSLQKKQEYDSSISDIRSKDRLLSNKIQQFLAQRLADVAKAKPKIKRSPSYSSTFESNANVLKQSSATLSRSSSGDRLSRSLNSNSSSNIISDNKFSASIDGHLATIDGTIEHVPEEPPRTRKLKLRSAPSDDTIKQYKPRPAVIKAPSISSTVVNSDSIFVDESISLAETLNSSKATVQANIPAITVSSDAQTSTSKLLSNSQMAKKPSLGSLQVLKEPKVQISNFDAFQKVYANVEAMISEQEEIFSRVNNTKPSLLSKPLSTNNLSKPLSSSVKLNNTLSKVNLKVSKDPIISALSTPQQSTKQVSSKDKIEDVPTIDGMLNDVGVQDIDVFLKKYGNMLLTSYKEDLDQIADEIAGQLIGAELKSH